MKRSKEFADGYTKALLDMDELLQRYYRSLSSRGMLSLNANERLRTITDAMIKYRILLMTKGLKNVDMIMLRNKEIKFKEKA